MELFGLKDKDGRGWILYFDDKDKQKFEEFVHVKPECKFKVGDWVTDDSYKEVFRFNSAEKDGRIYDDNNYLKNANYKWLRHATPQEIESHLRKICDEKYIGKVVKSVINSEYCDIVKGYYAYYPIHDTLEYSATNNCVITIYKQGKFADIIPQKKKLPKTKEELRYCILEFLVSPKTSSDKDWHCEVDEFLDEYED